MRRLFGAGAFLTGAFVFGCAALIDLSDVSYVATADATSEGAASGDGAASGEGATPGDGAVSPDAACPPRPSTLCGQTDDRFRTTAAHVAMIASAAAAARAYVSRSCSHRPKATLTRSPSTPLAADRATFFGSTSSARTTPNPPAGEVHMTSKDGVGLFTVADEVCLENIAASDRYVVWTAYGDVRSAHFDGGHLEALASDQAAFSLAVFGPTVYWASPFAGGIETNTVDAPPCDGNACDLTGVGSLVTGIAADRSGLFWTQVHLADDAGQTTGSVWLGIDGGGRQLATGQPGPDLPALAADRVFWRGRTGISMATRDGGDGGVVIPESVRQLMVSGDRLYWTRDDVVRSSDLNGQDVRTLASGQVTPWGLAADDLAIYWVNRGTNPATADGRVMKIAR